MKKLLTVILATVMLFSVIVTSVYADEQLNTNANGDSTYYFGYEEKWNCLGTITFTVGTRVLEQKVEATYTGREEIVCHFYSQCAVNYADETQDFDYTFGTRDVTNKNSQSISKSMTLPSGKTIVSFDGECQVYSNQTTIWEGLVGHTYTPGIDI